MKEITDTPKDRAASVSAMVDLSLVPEGKEPEGGLITSWQLLDRLIPRGFAQAVAYELHCAVKYVNAWCRKSEGDTASGQRNPIDRVCKLIKAVHRFNPLGSAFIVEFIVNFHRQLSKKEAARGFASSEARRDETAELLVAATNCVNSLNTFAATDESLFALVELRERCNGAIEKVQTEIVDRARQSRDRARVIISK
jgi:hypothetical protein